jgi:light-regulated signal transduction histidine kinase (bacteriophytochrome)
VALTGEAIQFTNYSVELDMHFETRIYCPKRGYFAALFADVTESKKAEEKVRQLNDVLEQRVEERTAQLLATNQELESFSYSISHDLRAPLRIINGYTKILSEDYSSAFDDEGQRICEVIRNETQRMGQLIDDILALSKMGRSEMNIAAINMKEMAAAVFAELATPEARQRIEFTLGTLLPAKGDPPLIHQVWVNLLENAIKFSSKEEQAIVAVESTQSENEAIYSIRDNGAGFDMEFADELFSAFKRLHTNREFEGTGVGLAIVQRIIHRHGGRVWAEGEVGEGATFYFSLPTSQ